MGTPCLLDAKGCWVIWMEGQVQDDMIVVSFLLGCWAGICFGTGDCFVEEIFNFISFVSLCNQLLEKDLCSFDFIIVAQAKGKNSKQCAKDNPW